MRCKARTRLGARCKRDARDSSQYCWQHEEIYSNPKKRLRYYIKIIGGWSSIISLVLSISLFVYSRIRPNITLDKVRKVVVEEITKLLTPEQKIINQPPIPAPEEMPKPQPKPTTARKPLLKTDGDMKNVQNGRTTARTISLGSGINAPFVPKESHEKIPKFIIGDPRFDIEDKKQLSESPLLQVNLGNELVKWSKFKKRDNYIHIPSKVYTEIKGKRVDLFDAKVYMINGSMKIVVEDYIIDANLIHVSEYQRDIKIGEYDALRWCLILSANTGKEKIIKSARKLSKMLGKEILGKEESHLIDKLNEILER